MVRRAEVVQSQAQLLSIWKTMRTLHPGNTCPSFLLSLIPPATQIVWDSSTKVGCGIAKCRKGRNKSLMFVCNYLKGFFQSSSLSVSSLSVLFSFSPLLFQSSSFWLPFFSFFFLLAFRGNIRGQRPYGSKKRKQRKAKKCRNSKRTIGRKPNHTIIQVNRGPANFILSLRRKNKNAR